MCANHHSNVEPKKGNGSDSNAKRECTTYKYSNKGNGQLHEAVMLSGHPVFLQNASVCAETGYSIVDVTEEEWAYLHNKSEKGDT